MRAAISSLRHVSTRAAAVASTADSLVPRTRTAAAGKFKNSTVGGANDNDGDEEEAPPDEDPLLAPAAPLLKRTSFWGGDAENVAVASQTGKRLPTT